MHNFHHYAWPQRISQKTRIVLVSIKLFSEQLHGESRNPIISCPNKADCSLGFNKKTDL